MLSNLLKLPGSEEREVNKVLRQAEKYKTPVRIEIENSNVRFYSILSIKRGLVVVAKPPGLKGGVSREGFVRFRVPDSEDKEIRMEVTVPHFNLLSGGYVFLCRLPKEFAESSKRNSERYNTSRFNNLHLFIPEMKVRYRIIDISSTGCKVFTEKSNPKSLFEVGKPLSPASISVGDKVEIDLASAIPRSHHRNTVGFELRVDGGGSSGKYLSHFLKSLETAETTRLRVDSV